MRPIFKYSLLAGLLPFVACSKTAVEDEESCLDPSYKVPLEVTVNLDDRFSDYKTIDSVFNKSDTLLTRALRSDQDEPPHLKYYVAAYPMTSGLPTVVKSSEENKMSLSVHPGRYTMVGWVMYEAADKKRGLNFYDDDFSELLLKNKYSYTGADIFKIAYRASEAKNVPYNATAVSVTAKPAMGLYKLVATDMDSIDYVPDKAIIYYTSLLPAAIHAKTGRINWWWSDINYTTKPVERVDSLGDLLASDYVISYDGQETSVTATVEVYDDEGRMRARKRNLKIPLTNGGITTIKGNFYSVYEFDNSASAGSGIHIKTEWDATFEIVL